MSQALLAAAVGLLWGARHAFEPDHLAAVSTLAAGDQTARAPWRLGALWGLGHSLSLLLFSGALVVLEVAMPPRVSQALELVVAAMLLLLGARALWRAFTQGTAGPTATHSHGALFHTHAAPTEHLHLRRWTLAARPLWVGLMHGLAGSGALTTLVLAELHSSSARLLYIAFFGFGSTAGMAAMTGVLGASLSRLAGPRTSRWILCAAGLASVTLGIFWALQASVLAT